MGRLIQAGKTYKKKSLLGFLLFLFGVGYIFSAEPVNFSARQVKSIFAEGREETFLSGQAVIVTGAIKIEAEAISLYGKNQRYVQSKGFVKIRDDNKKLSISGDSLLYDREEDVLFLKGSVLLEDFENSMVLRGDIMEHRNKENLTIVQIGVRAFKKDLTAKAELLLYRRNQDIVELSGLPIVYRKKDVYQAGTITINIKTDEIILAGKVQGKVEGSEKE